MSKARGKVWRAKKALSWKKIRSEPLHGIGRVNGGRTNEVILYFLDKVIVLVIHV